MYWRQSLWFLSRTLLKRRVKPQKQPLQLFCKKRSFQKFYKFHRKTSVSKFLFIRVTGQETPTQMFSCGVQKFLEAGVYERLLLKPVGVSLNQLKLVYSFHCAKSVQIRSAFWSVFSRNRTEYRAVRSIQSKCGKMRTRKNSVFGHFSRSVLY